MAIESGTGTKGAAGIQKHDVERLTVQAQELSKSLSSLTAEKEFKEFILSIHRDGYTRPAEWTFLTGIIGAMQAQVQVLGDLKQTLFEGDRQVTIER